jgi:hypothetical protein
MGRPKLTTPRDRQFNVSLTEAEWSALQRAARLALMRPVDFGRAKLLAKSGHAQRAAEAAPHLDPLLLQHLSRLGNNLNQIARRLNELRLPVSDELDPLLAEIRGILRTIPRP